MADTETAFVPQNFEPVETTNLTARDAQQSKHAGRFRARRVMSLVGDIAEMNYNSLEVDGGTRGEVPMTFLGENPWQNLRDIRAAAPDAQLQMLGRGQTCEGQINYPDDVVYAFYAAKADNGVNVFRLFDALNDFKNLETAIQALKDKKAEGKDVTIEGALAFTKSPLHTIEYWVKKAHELKAMGCDRLCIKDMAGLMTPEDARELIPALKDVGLEITLHMHATNGIAEATLLEALDLDIDKIDLADHDCSGGSGHVSSKRFLFLAENHLNPKISARAPRIELGDENFSDNLLEASLIARDKAAAHDPKLQKMLLDSGIPGGMLTTFKDNVMPQLEGRIKALQKQGLPIPKELNWEEALPDMLQEIVRVRKDFGYVPLVTPSSQVVAIQAAQNYMDFLSRTDGKKLEDLTPQERYKTLIPGAKGYLLGRLGQNIQDPDEWLVKRAEEETGQKRTTERHSASLPDGLPAARERIREAAKKAKQLLPAKPDNWLSDSFNNRGNLAQRKVRANLDALINKEIPIEDVLLAALFDLPPKSDGTTSVINKACLTPEKMPKFEREPALPDYLTAAPSSRSGAKGYHEITSAIGKLTLERLSQAAIELTRLTDGTIKGLDENLHTLWADEVSSEMNDLVEKIAKDLTASGFTQKQRWEASFKISAILTERAQELGVSQDVTAELNAVLKKTLVEAPKAPQIHADASPS